ncbi:MAG: chorismate-binding protein, partial [Bacteroidales bacterium]|nr:chorismate-binding protein [Bacteroidales bacterium]
LIHPFAENGQKLQFIKADVYCEGSISSSEFEMLQNIKGVESADKTNYPIETGKEEYLKLLDETIKVNKSGKYHKIVISRAKLVEGRFKEFLADIFIDLCEAYANAFVFLFNTGDEIWMGATPEPFLISNNCQYKTSAIAGTKRFCERNLNLGVWEDKEKHEQQYVSDYIKRVLLENEILNQSEEGPYLKRAGNLIHLRTDFQFEKKFVNNSLASFIADLHPTPAVCGIPKSIALQYIKKNERYDREYYAGFLGVTGINDKLSLFVNLRSMKVFQSKVALFVGGGITSESTSEAEWNETEIKAETLLSILKKYGAAEN